MTNEQLNEIKKTEAFRRSASRMERANAGSFATAIAKAYYYADIKNARKLEQGFAELFMRFMTIEELELFKDPEEEKFNALMQDQKFKNAWKKIQA
jgi:hypothetical protein